MERLQLKIFSCPIIPCIPEANPMEEAEMTTSSEHPMSLPVQDDQDAQKNLPQPAPQASPPSLLPSALAGAGAVPHPEYSAASDLEKLEQFQQSAVNGDRGRNQTRQSNAKFNSRTFGLTMAIGMIIGMLPALSVGTVTFFFGQKILKQTAIQVQQSGGVPAIADIEQRNQQYSELLNDLLMGTGLIALFFGGLGAQCTHRMVRSAVKLGATTADDSGQKLFLEESRTLTDVVSRIHRAGDEQAIFEAAVNGLRDVLSCDRIVLYRFNNGSGGVAVAESVAQGLPKALGTALQDPYSLAGQGSMGDRNSYAVDDLKDLLVLPDDFQHLEALRVKSSLGAMLLREQEPFGAIIAQSCHQPRHWLPSEIALIEHLAMEVGLALETTQQSAERDLLEQRLVLETNWKACLEETTRSLHSVSDPIEVQEIAVKDLRRVLDCDRTLFCRLDESQSWIVVAESLPPGHVKTLGQPFASLVSPGVAMEDDQREQEDRMNVIDNLNEAGLSLDALEQLTSLAIRASLVAPVFSEGKLSGLLMAHHDIPRHWSDLEVRGAKQLATQVGYALENVTYRQQINQPVQPLQADSESNLSWLQMQDAQAMATRLMSTVAQQRTQIATITAQLQTVADATRLIAGKVQTAEQELPNVGQVLQEGHEHVNQMIDILAELQETVAGHAHQSHYLSASAQSISQSMTKIHDLAEHIGQTSIHLSILSGQSREDIQSSVSTVSRTVLDATQQIMAATAQLSPLATQIESESQSIMHGMEVGTEQVLVGTELVKETRYKLNQLTQYGDRLDQLLQRIVEASPSQSQTLTAITQQMQEMTSLVNQTLEQATELSASLHPPNGSG
jgi:methyl-accepting chemotaxis protein PixJ